MIVMEDNRRKVDIEIRYIDRKTGKVTADTALTEARDRKTTWKWTSTGQQWADRSPTYKEYIVETLDQDPMFE
jgi:hypothetical protein